MPTLRQLRYLAALAEHGHFGRAAAACHVTQPALSMQIKELEAELDLPLVERGRTGAVLTEEGVELAQRARALNAGVKDLEDFARERRGDRAQRLALGIIPSVAPYLLPRLLPLLQAAMPGLDLKVRETQTAVLMAELAGGELDAVIAALPLAGDGIEAVALFEDAFLLASPADDPVAAASPRDLPPDRLLLLEEGHCLRDQALGACEISDLSTFGATSLTTLVQLVAHGQGVTLLPAMAADALADPRIVLARFSDPQPSRTIALAWRTASPRRRQLKDLAARIAEQAAR
ncbi:LysR substrate-binding domain-containing protein [Phenylobacterium sp. LH3H17]|uniref:hydrogen peroxide-inducible genes activator n=1 Tax=Phenylobacterium sp. LH3H17 TaxID=2903901 RepID=UPI0020C9806D|nr:hydrogen peroxide-inducible genes activator [Phenylobacterium sp. LH3H17]UTP40638.1 LysR substrate-binding domain-containing protein [Phenylobacterium sp. LH3H17]